MNENNQAEVSVGNANNKRSIANGLLVVVGLVALLLAILLSWQSWNYVRLRVEVAFAEEQTRIFAEARSKALESSVTEAAELLDHIQYYYPSGSKQRAGSHLDRIVERDRVGASRDVIHYLRQKTGEDLGEKPEPWVQKYAGKK